MIGLPSSIKLFEGFPFIIFYSISRDYSPRELLGSSNGFLSLWERGWDKSFLEKSGEIIFSAKFYYCNTSVCYSYPGGSILGTRLLSAVPGWGTPKERSFFLLSLMILLFTAS